MHEKRTSIRIHTDNLMRQIKRNERLCRCCCVGREEEFDFFPISFLLYNILLVIVSLVIMFKYTIDDHHFNTLWLANHDAIILHKDSETIDWIICYLLILLSLWECLFNFYRFYTTYFASKKMMILAPKNIIFKFALFGVPFLLIFLIQIHVFYYLYPLVICCYLIFNVVCVWLFGHILIVQYRFVMGTETYLTNIHDEMLESVYMMRRLSFISSISSSIYIAIFTLFSSIHIILFIPILWSVSCICLALNFVRNRIFIHSKYLSFKLWSYSLSSQCTCTRTCPYLYKANRRRISSANNNTTQAQQSTVSAHDHTVDIKDEAKEEQEDRTQHEAKDDRTQSVMLNTSNKEATPSNTVTAKQVKWYNAVKNKISTPLTNEGVDFSFSPIAPTINIPTCSPKNRSLKRKQSASKSKGKALKVLGLDREASIIASKQKSDRSQSSISPQKLYIAPTTPMPALFTHLKAGAQSHHFPNTLPLPPDSNVCDDTPNSQETVNSCDDAVIQQRDEFNEHEMAEITKRFEKKHDLIRVSAQAPHLLMQRISVNLDTPPIAPAAVHVSPRDSVDSEKQVCLLMNDHMNEDAKEKDEMEAKEAVQVSIEVSHSGEDQSSSADVPAPVAQLQVTDSASHRRSQSAQAPTIERRLSSKGLTMLKKMSPRRLKKIKLTKRFRSESDARATGNDVTTETAVTDGNHGPMYDNPDVVSMFGVLAKHGFYDNNNVVCAKQLRDYTGNMKI